MSGVWFSRRCGGLPLPDVSQHILFSLSPRILPAEHQYQCVNQQCGYYGKPLCEVCEQLVEEDAPPAVYLEPQEGYWPLLLIAVIAAAWFVWSRRSFGSALLWVLFGFPLIGGLLQAVGINIFGKQRRVEHSRKSRFRRCLCCQQPVKEIVANAVFPNSWYGAETATGQMTDTSKANLPGGSR